MRGSAQGIIAAFGQTFVKAEIVDARFHKYLVRDFDLRQESDYRLTLPLTNEKVREGLGWAKEFVAACRSLGE